MRRRCRRVVTGDGGPGARIPREGVTKSPLVASQVGGAPDEIGGRLRPGIALAALLTAMQRRNGPVPTLGESPGHGDTDAALVERALEGDGTAFEALVYRHQERVYGLLRRLLRDAEDAEDALQETFLHVYRDLDSFRGESRFSTWIYRVASNTALSHLRRRRRRPTESLEAFLPRFDEEGRHATRPDVGHSPSERTEERLDRQRIAEHAISALERLPETYRTVVVLRDLEELTTAEAAEVLGVTEASLRQRLHRARLMLRGYLASLVGTPP